MWKDREKGKGGKRREAEGEDNRGVGKCRRIEREGREVEGKETGRVGKCGRKGKEGRWRERE